MYTGTSKHSYSKKEGWKHSKERWDKNKTEAQEEQHQILHFWGSWWNRLGLTLGSSTAPAQLSVLMWPLSWASSTLCLSFPQQMSHDSGISYTLESPLQFRLYVPSFMRWPSHRESDTLPSLSVFLCSLYFYVFHACKTSILWMMLSSTSCLICSLIPLYTVLVVTVCLWRWPWGNTFIAAILNHWTLVVLSF